MNYKPLILALAALLPVHLLAGSCDAGDSRNTIRVVGETVVSAMPNYAVINLQVWSRNKILLAAKQENKLRMGKVIQAAKSFGLESKDITTHTMKIENQYIPAEGVDAKKSSAERFVGSDVTQVVDLILYDLKNYQPLLDKIVGAGIASLKDVDYRNTENRKYQDQARVAAMKAAREKAVMMADALDQKVGKALKIDEDADASGYRTISGASGLENQYIIGGIYLSQGPETEYPVAGLITYRQKVCVSFELQ